MRRWRGGGDILTQSLVCDLFHIRSHEITGVIFSMCQEVES